MPSHLPNTVHIAPATPADIPTILSLIKELAEFEKLTHLVVATEPMLRESLFGPQPKAEVVIAFLNNEPVGFALFFHNFSTFLGRRGLYLEDLFVRPTARCQGIGKALFLHVGAIAKERDCGRYEWSVLDWNEHAIRFYKSLDAQPMKEWIIMRLTGEALDKLPAPKTV
ncbi:MAG TPA: GNAT family N-acetyltransferase [Burkholderiales bacterium]|nr:GNAT family N-acetyltransferase [Burkholderiales bacterium]